MRDVGWDATGHPGSLLWPDPVGASGHVKVPLYADYQINLGPFTSDTWCMPDPPTNKSITGCKVLAKVEKMRS